VTYVGQQHVDELDTYVFDVSPKPGKNDKDRFRGRIWVDDRDLMIVKTCGKTRTDANSGNRADVTPTFVTYRQQIDGQFWFPTYARADQLLHFPRQNVYIREVVKYSNYKSFATK
jgi:outer membrane lipoprotein-sorting protein